MLRQEGVRLLILSTCRLCGASNLASAQDGSIQDWEDGHACEKQPPKKEAVGAVPIAGIRSSRQG